VGGPDALGLNLFGRKRASAKLDANVGEYMTGNADDEKAEHGAAYRSCR